MASVNRVTILGNLGQDPDLRYTPSGSAVCNFSVATTEAWNDRDGNRQETTEWHRIVVWNKQAENCAKYLAKGRTVYVEGKLQTRSWDDKATGQKRYATDIVAQTVQFVGGGQARDSYQGQQQQSYGQQQGGYSAPAPSSNYQNQGQSDFGSTGNDFGAPSTPNLDDIPF